MLQLLATPFLATALVVLRPPPAAPGAESPSPPALQSVAACDDGTSGGSLVQRGDTWYGNRFEAVCPSARLTALEFAYTGAGMPGPYAYRIHVLDAECRALAVSPVWTLPDAAGVAATATVDVSTLGVCVGAAFAVVIEPLTCADGAARQDCMPALVVDASSDAQEAAHCGLVNTATSGGRECLAPRSADGRFFDFRLRAQVDCSSVECTTATAPADWSRIKRLYR